MRPPYSSSPDAVRTTDAASWTAIAEDGFLISLANFNSEDWQRPRG